MGSVSVWESSAKDYSLLMVGSHHGETAEKTTIEEFDFANQYLDIYDCKDNQHHLYHDITMQWKPINTR